MRRLPPLNQLRAFEACARHLSFKEAADELGVTPTAVSHQIRLLELYVHRSLIRRRPRPIALTPAGGLLFPIVRDALDRLSAGVSQISGKRADPTLRITTTNAFAARWLAPRLSKWRQEHAGVRIDVVGTDAVLDLARGEADVAIRYCRRAPSGAAVLLARDRFHVVANPSLLGKTAKKLTPRQIVERPLIEAGWPADDPLAPTWRRWMEAAKIDPRSAPEPGLLFQEELHAIEAVIAGQGVGICSNLLIGPELASGALVAVSSLTLPGYGFYVVYRSDHPKIDTIRAFATWAANMARTA